MYVEDKDIHKGHRSRMRSKLESYGPRIFDTYELLEMLLYYAIPYKDTNPIAKRLLSAFGSLDGVLSAPKEALAEVDGIGERCAELISLVGRAVKEDAALVHRIPVHVFDDYHKTGKFVASYFESSSSNVCVMLLDNGMRLIGVEDIPADDFSTAAVKPRYFVNAALSSGAAVVVIAHKRHSLLFFSESALATDRMIRSELAGIGVTVAEHYVVSGKEYSGLHPHLTLGASNDTPELERFLESVQRACGGEYEE